MVKKEEGEEKMKKWGKWHKGESSKSSEGGIYGVGFVGALIYNMQAAVGFGAVVTGLLKSMIWPAYVVYKLLEGFYGVVN
jgi:hypothetical protein